MRVPGVATFKRTAMFARLFEKELKLVLLSPKFVATFGVSSILIILSVFIGVQDYKASVRQYESAGQLADQELREATSWFGLGNTVHRRPDVMQIFAAGVNNDIGRLSQHQYLERYQAPAKQLP